MNTTAHISKSQAELAKQKMRFTPLSAFKSPLQIAQRLDAFEAGYLRETVNIWNSLEQRDDLIRTVVAKRKKSIGREGWTVLAKNDLTPDQVNEAKRHIAALEHFYNHLECENAIDAAEKGGFKLLIRQMMDAVGKRFAVHEIVWRPDASSPAPDRDLNPDLSATFRFVPLSFFENTTGRLRFLESESESAGKDLEPGAWMVTAGEGLMAATSMAWILKNLALNDWLRFSERNGLPGVLGVTAATEGDDEWNALDKALNDLLNGRAVVHSSSDQIKVLDLAAGGNTPFPALVERMDRMIAALWRGADLSTLSRDRGYGASLQEKETCALEEDDAEMLTETLNRYVDEWVIKYIFGDAVKPLAHVKVLVSPRECTATDIQIDQFLLQSGAELSLQETMSRYGRALPKAGESTLKIEPSQRQKINFRSSRGHETHSLNDATTQENQSLLTSTATTDDLRASYPESSHSMSAPESAQSSAMGRAMNNETFAPGPSVSFRDSSPNTPDLDPDRNLLVPVEAEDSANRLRAGLGLRAGEESQPAAIIENEFTLTQPDWLQLTPYGDFPHARGLQRVNRAAADGMVAQFNSFRGRLGRLFGGVPFYIGHPDVPSASELADRKAYGWVTQIESREDGLYGQVKWSDAGLDLLKNAHFKYLSPFWEAREIGNENGRRVYQPVALVSVGLTNQPNIPVRPLANALAQGSSGEMPNDQVPMPREITGTNDQTPEHLTFGFEKEMQASSAGSSRGDETQMSPSATAAPMKNQSLVTSTATKRRGMHTESLTNHLGTRRGELVLMHNRRDRIQEAVLVKVKLGLTYDEAWEAVKRENAVWFE